MLYTPHQLQALAERRIAGLLDVSAHQPQGLYDPIRYILEDGGKRMRPLLTLLACNAYCDTPQRALAPAVAVEVFHNFTLLHDDIMDAADIRRGRPTVHKTWGQSGAILSGDAMLILAYQILCGQETRGGDLPQQLKVFNKAAMEVCQGQQYDMEFERAESVTREQYLEMIRLKTAVLMAAALELGAIAGGAAEGHKRAIYEFGIQLGLAFQIQDDLLDTYGDAATFGKEIGGDIAAGKKTFLHIAAMERASAVEQGELLAAGVEGEPREPRERKFERVRAIYDRLGVRQVAQEAIAAAFERALSVLKTAHSDPARLRELEQYAHSLVKRSK